MRVIFLVLLLLFSHSSLSATKTKSKVGAVAKVPTKFASLVMDISSGQILHAVNADAPRSPASLTKLMTLYLTFEAMNKGYISPETEMIVSKFAASKPATNIALKAGEKLKVKDAVVALIVRSANDAAAVLAEHLGGTEERFARMMTKKARMLSMNATVFKNASGLPAKGQITTAFEMARLSLALRKNFPQFYPLFSVTSFKYKDRLYASHNKLTKHYINVDGLKTGYTAASGFNLVSSVTSSNRNVIGVVLGGNTANERDMMMVRLLQKFVAIERDNVKNPYRVISANKIFEGL